MDKINAKVAKLSVEMLKEMSAKLFDDTRAESDIVLSAVLDRLMAIMPEDQFISFCTELEG